MKFMQGVARRCQKRLLPFLAEGTPELPTQGTVYSDCNNQNGWWLFDYSRGFKISSDFETILIGSVGRLNAVKGSKVRVCLYRGAFIRNTWNEFLKLLIRLGYWISRLLCIPCKIKTNKNQASFILYTHLIPF